MQLWCPYPQFPSLQPAALTGTRVVREVGEQEAEVQPGGTDSPPGPGAAPGVLTVELGCATGAGEVPACQRGRAACPSLPSLFPSSLSPRVVFLQVC